MPATHRTPKLLAAVIWLAAGTALAVRGVGLLRTASTAQGASGLAIGLSVAAGLVLGALKGRYVLSRTARRNVRRIEALREPRAWNAFTPRFFVVILGMIGLGMTLRALAARGWIGGYLVVGGIYVGIGAALVTSAAAYRYRRPAPTVDTCAAIERARARGGAGAPPTGVLVVNLGTPASPTTRDVRRYLRQFLGDPRVVEVNRALWWFVLNVIILPFRSSKSAALYRSVWTAEGSPLLVNAREQARLLARELGAAYQVELAMRYGEPSIAATLDRLLAAGCEHVVLLPMFPQYSATTTASVVDEVARCMSRLRRQPTLSVVPPYFADPGYVEALAARAREAQGDAQVDHHVFSFHGVPESYVERGDPYHAQCAATAVGLASALGLGAGDWSLVFQSRFGDEPWLQPYADELVPSLAERCPRILVSTPAFTADCLETIEEIGLALKESFLEAGGASFLRAPCLNDHPRWIASMARLVRGASPEPDEELPDALSSSHERSGAESRA